MPLPPAAAHCRCPLPTADCHCLLRLLTATATADCTGWMSLELMNPTLWQANPQQVAEIGLTALRKVLGLS